MLNKTHIITYCITRRESLLYSFCFPKCWCVHSRSSSSFVRTYPPRKKHIFILYTYIYYDAFKNSQKRPSSTFSMRFEIHSIFHFHTITPYFYPSVHIKFLQVVNSHTFHNNNNDNTYLWLGLLAALSVPSIYIPHPINSSRLLFHGRFGSITTARKMLLLSLGVPDAPLSHIKLQLHIRDNLIPVKRPSISRSQVTWVRENCLQPRRNCFMLASIFYLSLHHTSHIISSNSNSKRFFTLAYSIKLQDQRLYNILL